MRSSPTRKISIWRPAEARQRPVTVLIEGDQAVGGGDAEQNRGAGDEHADAQIARDDRNEEPVAEIGDEIALVPPRRPGLQAQNTGQHGEDARQAPARSGRLS